MTRERESFSAAKRIKSFAHGFRGLTQAFHTEHNLWIHSAITLSVIVAGFFFGITKSEWLWLILATGLVWMAELFNTALEYLADALQPNHNEMIGKAKDISASAVLITAFTAVVIGALIFWPYLF